MAGSPRRKPAHRLWVFPSDEIAPQRALELAKTLRISPVLARLLLRRGFDSPEKADAFLSRKLTLLHDPAALPDIDAAVKRVLKAVENNERIVLFGDYDADGITSTALMGRFLLALKRFTKRDFDVVCRVPQRAHGYGLSKDAIQGLLALKPKVLITLDNGISSHEALDVFAQHGIDCIVVDHHHVGETLPKAVAVVNPKRPDSAYPFKELCGAGIAFKVAWAIAVAASQSAKVAPELREFLLDALAFAAIGTIADVVPLVDENRILAHQGLVALHRTKIPGLRALIETSSIEEAPRASDVAFRIAPRLNAAGRCGEVNEALELLLTDDPARAGVLALQMEHYNTERQTIEQRILDDARAQALQAVSANDKIRALVLSSSEWHQGVVGIVASRIVEEFFRPSVLLSIDATTGLARGSGRSIPGFHLAEALQAAHELLTTHGGHAAAAGLSIQTERIDAFRQIFESHTDRILTDEHMQPQLRLDERVTLGELSATLCEELEKFEPCGMGNPRPLFAASGVSLAGRPTLMGREESHVSFFGKQDRTSLRCIGFHFAAQFNTLCDAANAGRLHLAFRPQLNTFKGRNSVELILEAFQTE